MSEKDLKRFGYSPAVNPEIIKPYIIGMDIVRTPKRKWIIDLFGLTESEVAKLYPQIYQHVYETVRPVRLQNREPSRKKNWWLFARSNEDLRDAVKPLGKFIATPNTSRFKPFTFIDYPTLPDSQVYCITSEDAWILGTLESCIHQVWIRKVAPRMGKGNDLRWTPATVFDPFPFPDPTPEQKQKIRDLGERLDAHRKSVQAAHPDITITGMYNLLEKLRAGQPFTEVDRAYNNRALVSTLKQIHDDLDIAVLEAYGWGDLVPMLGPSPLAPLPGGEGNMNDPSGLPSPPGRRAGDEGQSLNDIILENLVALNAQRAEEERNGHIRWLRPEYQAPDEVQTSQPTLEGIIAPELSVIEPVEQQPWPTKPKDQLGAIRDLLRTTSGEWTVKQIAAQFKGRATPKRLDDITQNLERLEWFGLVISEEREEIPYWHFTESTKAA